MFVHQSYWRHINAVGFGVIINMAPLLINDRRYTKGYFLVYVIKLMG